MVPAAGQTDAATLEQAVFQEYVYAGGLFHGLGVDDTLPESFVESATAADESASGHVRTTGGAFPRAEGALTMQALGNPTRSMPGNFSARIYYERQVEQVGGDPWIGPVPIDVHTRGAVDSAVTYGASIYKLWAQAQIELPGAPPVAHSARACVRGVCVHGPISFDHAFSGHAFPGTAYVVELETLGSGYVSVDRAVLSMSGWVDPGIAISPSFERADDFRLVFSQGIAPVPEPTGLALFVVGGATLLIAVGRARRQRAGQSACPSPGGPSEFGSRQSAPTC